MAVSLSHSHQHDTRQKAKARKSGPSLLAKSEDLGLIADVFTLSLYWDPTHLHYCIRVHVPEGETPPDVNKLMADELEYTTPKRPHRPRRRGRTSQQPPGPQQPLRRSTRHRLQISSGQSPMENQNAITAANTEQMSNHDAAESDGEGSELHSNTSVDNIEARSVAGSQLGSGEVPGPSGSGESSSTDIPEKVTQQTQGLGVNETIDKMAESNNCSDGLDYPQIHDEISWADFNSDFVMEVPEDNLPTSQYSQGFLGSESRSTNSPTILAPVAAQGPYQIQRPSRAWRKALHDTFESLPPLRPVSPVSLVPILPPLSLEWNFHSQHSDGWIANAIPDGYLAH